MTATLCGDFADIAAAVREGFLAQAERYARSIERATGFNDERRPPVRRGAVIRAAHTLHDTAGAMGMRRIRRAAAIVESTARAPRLSHRRLAEAVGRLGAEVRRAADHARS